LWSTVWFPSFLSRGKFRLFEAGGLATTKDSSGLADSPQRSAVAALHLGLADLVEHSNSSPMGPCGRHCICFGYGLRYHGNRRTLSVRPDCCASVCSLHAGQHGPYRRFSKPRTLVAGALRRRDVPGMVDSLPLRSPPVVAEPISALVSGARIFGRFNCLGLPVTCTDSRNADSRCISRDGQRESQSCSLRQLAKQNR